MDEPADATPQAERQAAPRKVSRFLPFALVLLALVVAALWYDTRGRIGSTQEELARRLQEIESESRAAHTLGRQAQDGLRDAQAKIGALESRLAESQSQQMALESLYQELSRNRDEWQLAEIEQVLAIAQQQLQLSGNVRAALLALQLAESRLSRADRPQFLPVRRALTRDIERLKSLPALDVPGLSLTLDRLVASVDALPLAFDERVERPAPAKAGKGASQAAPAAAGATAAAAPPAEEGYFERLGSEIWRELRQLVVVRRIDTPEPPLLPPPQAYFLRENLKLKLLNARLALLTRDEAGYREDLRTAQAWIQRYFDAKAKNSQAALAQLKQLSAASVSFEPPSIADSLEAVRGFKSRRERPS
jgi:uncharacterized protein HemX